MGGSRVVNRIISIIRKAAGSNDTELGRENGPVGPSKMSQQPQPVRAQKSQQPTQDVYSKQEKMEETE